MNIPLRFGVVVAAGLAFNFGIHQSAKADAIIPQFKKYLNVPTYTGALQEKTSFGQTSSIRSGQGFTLDAIAARKADIKGSSLILGPEAASFKIPGCNQAYKPAELSIMNPQLNCGEHVVVTNKKGVTLELVNIGKVTNLGSNPLRSDTSVISMAAAKRFGFDPTVRAANMLGIVRLKNGETIANLPRINLDGKAPPPALHPDLKAEDRKIHTANIYHEARGETAGGAWYGVWLSAVNRERLGTYGKSLRSVVYSGAYSWTLHGPRAMQEQDVREDIDAAVVRFQQGELNASETAEGFVLGPDMTNYHSTICARGHEKECHPNWRMRFIAQIGHHKFYGPYRPRMVASR